MPTARELVNMGYHGYAGWGDAEADADFRATGGAGKGGPSSSGSGQKSAQQIVDDIIRSQEETIKRETQFLEKYTADNPFVFDEALARESASAEYSPYYDQIMDRYLEDIGVGRESIQSEQRLLADLQSTPKGTAGQAQRQYERAVAKAQQGYAEQGTFFSGTSKRSLGEAEVERGAQVQQQATDIQRKNIDIFGDPTTGRKGELGTAVEGGVLQRQQEALKQYYTPLEQSYFRQFPSGNGASLQGYIPSEYLRL